jgi:tripartite ATP-independent transporter DctM subunit
MEWWLILTVIFISLMAAMATGIPVAFAFMILNVGGLFIITGGSVGFALLPGAIYTSVANFPLLALPMFFLLGEILYHSGVFGMVMDVTDKWIGGVRARLLFVALGAGTILAALSGAGMADTALLGSTIFPEVETRGYDRRLSLGVITSAGLLAVLIPPSGLAVLLGSLAEVSIAGLLIGGIGPGLLMVFFYFWYIIIRVRLNPALAPAYDEGSPTLGEKVKATVLLTPLLLIIVGVVGFILLGIATPSEAAATGALMAVVVTLIYRRLTWDVLKKSFLGVVKIVGMVLLIISGAVSFGQLLAMTGAAREFMEFLTGLPVHPIIILIAIQLAVLLLGFFIDGISIMMITIPVLVPVVKGFEWNPIWFWILFLVNMTIGSASPPFGLALFALKGVVPSYVTMGDIYRAQIPFIAIDVVVVAVIIFIPGIATFLPSLIQT